VLFWPWRIHRYLRTAGRCFSGQRGFAFPASESEDSVAKDSPRFFLPHDCVFWRIRFGGGTGWPRERGAGGERERERDYVCAVVLETNVAGDLAPVSFTTLLKFNKPSAFTQRLRRNGTSAPPGPHAPRLLSLSPSPSLLCFFIASHAVCNRAPRLSSKRLALAVTCAPS